MQEDPGDEKVYDVKIEYDLESNQGRVYYRGIEICEIYLGDNNLRAVKEGVRSRDDQFL